MFRLRALSGVVVLVAALLTTGGMPVSAQSDDSKLCQKNGYTLYTTSDGAPFTSASECKKYVKAGGALTPIPPPAFIDIVLYVNRVGILVVEIVGSGLLPGSAVTAVIEFSSGTSVSQELGFVFSNGVFTFIQGATSGPDCTLVLSYQVIATSASGDTLSDAEAMPC